MKLNWWNRKLTFVVIRDANESVIRFRMSSIILILIPAIIIFSAVAIFILSKLYINTMDLSKQLESNLQEEVAEHDAIVGEKDRTIEQLMSDVVELTDQSQLVQDKLKELQQISDQIRSINGEPSASLDTESHVTYSEPDQDVMIASVYSAPPALFTGDIDIEATPDSKLLEVFDGMLISSSYSYDLANGQGGKYELASVNDILTLAEDTKANLQILDERMGQLKIDLEEAKEIAIQYQHLLRITPSIWPTSSRRITSTFGYRKDPFTRRLSHHSGIDFGGKTGDPVYAAADGKIIESSYDSALGHHVVIDHTNGLRTVYAHLSQRLVAVGDKVEKGEQIGKLGSTGRSTGPHLHYEVYKNGVAVNPRPYLP